MAKKKNQSGHNAKHIDKNIESDGTVTVDLQIDMNCESCARKVVKFVHSLDGVESVERGDNDWMKITVVGKVDPVELCENVKGKIKKNVELVSPATKKKNSSGREHENQQKQQKQVPVTTTVLKMPLHCEGCIKKIQDLVRKTEGFVEMSIDKGNDLVIVKGAMDMKLLMTTLKDKLNKKVEIVQAKGSGGKKGKGGSGDEEGEGKESGGGGPIVAEYNHRMEHFTGQGEYMYQGQYMYPQYVSWPEFTFNYTHATQMFNDENPNACVIM
ncbi:putative heavy metal-associated domain, HMA, heavy metal-associated domain superfamily [Helianthus annuus]|uniref:Heavy metal-associated domain, HMA, heavy metal-associated domain superfamily n=1 Tax=Helianthus annuus TaxID=4232 RepID=A0A251TRX0_HELAN|nr:heavy metal-associated isoprenylated plant protein 3 isoform X1 [Helianthus annuus]KAF5772692.1 putative heavy metal-associated domain, HMA, heavy metal-associated domain superfamily [Helianthus annuus]KAJ0480425.1 putative heavy metal-associated domain, HMA, heavy metal-associated domain superfamily [Helianthus annuus]KAJ0630077.1 putative heavy metal-associated isoprenylated plant protein/5/6 [Helianthus annuus]KAJ0848512.1 putative heavy metal-associated domain, HMA, heavy metal-associate